MWEKGNQQAKQFIDLWTYKKIRNVEGSKSRPKRKSILQFSESGSTHGFLSGDGQALTASPANLLEMQNFWLLPRPTK